MLALLIKKSRGEHFVYPYELTQDGDTFVGYKAPTRFCELMDDYPEMIESRKAGKYRVGRFRLEDTAMFLPTLPPRLRRVVERALTLHTDGFKVYETTYKYIPEKRMMRPVRRLVTKKVAL